MNARITARREALPASYALFDPLVEEWTQRGDVALGVMFGAEGLSVRGKVFAFATHTGDLMAQVSEPRAAEFIEAGAADPAVMRGRVMREWVTVTPDAAARWAPVVAAFDFVDEITP